MMRLVDKTNKIEVVAVFTFPKGKSAPKGDARHYECITECKVLVGPIKSLDSEKQKVATGTVKHVGANQNLTIARNFALYNALKAQDSISLMDFVWNGRTIRKFEVK